jgi:hypothetical protein
MRLPNRPVRLTSLSTYLTLIILGVVGAEVWYLSRAISLQISNQIISEGKEILVLSLVGLSIIFLVTYLLARNFFGGLIIIYKSGRLELIIPIALGVILSVSSNGIGGTHYSFFVSHLNQAQLITLALLPFLIIILTIIEGLKNHIQKGSGKKIEPPFFISDQEKEDPKDDQLGYAKQAEKFAERVLNRGSIDTMVFGIDAPWGIGKSTFINFCKKYWHTNGGKQLITYTFNPLRYEERNWLVEKFIDGLVRSIQKEVFLPEIRPLIARYTSFIKKTKATFSFFGINFELFSHNYTVEDALKDLTIVLSKLNKKIIVLVDDLDRLNFSSIKDVLFVINKSFALPNISYVLCYDTENISALEKDRPEVEKISEFFEKFVNVKISLFIDSEQLEKFIADNQIALQTQNPQINPILVGQALGGLKDIFKSDEYHEYLPFVGDIRKLKRLMNTITLLEIEKTDFENSDINNEDLIHLLLIYINYPNLFRKIYYTETHGRRGFFSAVTSLDTKKYPKEENNPSITLHEEDYQNSNNYNSFIKTLPSEQRFLLSKVFDVKTRLSGGTRIDGVPPEICRSYACFNGGILTGSGKNLEDYLELIINQSKPQKEKQYKYYLNKISEIKNGTSIEKILTEPEFNIENGEANLEHLWKAILNNLYDFNGEVGSRLITYILTNIQNFSFFSDQKIGVGFRGNMCLFLVKMLDTIGWTDENDQHRKNDTNNIKEIAEWVFGENRHSGTGVLQILPGEDRGVLGLYDLLCFRLFCSADRGGDIFNVTRAIALHGNPQAPTDGPTNDIAIEEMREISQRVFEAFKNQYIDKNVNILKQIDELELSDMTGQYDSIVQTKVKTGEIENLDTAIGLHKTKLKAFIIYQLGNSEILSGIGCGFYNPAGKENGQGIKELVNDYLFDICFNPKVDNENYTRFLDYLLINFSNVFSGNGRAYVPHINEFTKVLTNKRLAQYWTDHNVAIKALNLTRLDKKIYQSSYAVNYNTDLQAVFDELDKLLVTTTISNKDGKI